MHLHVKRKNGRSYRRRRGATVVEFAIVAPVVVLLTLGFAVLAMGVYRYQQVAYLAREGARYASTHGAQYRVDHELPVGDTTVWSQEIRLKAILPKCSSLVPANVAAGATWSAGDNRANAGSSASEFSSTIENSVAVTVSYQWFPETFLSSPITVASTATVPMAY